MEPRSATIEKYQNRLGDRVWKVILYGTTGQVIIALHRGTKQQAKRALRRLTGYGGNVRKITR